MSNASTQAGPPLGAGLAGGSPFGPRSLAGRRRPGESIIKAILLVSALLSIAITVGIIVALIRPVVDFFAEVPVGDFFSTQGEFAVIPLVTGTLLVTAIALLVAAPIGLGAAMYLAEYASPRMRKILKPTVELLAGVPSVVYGFFALAFVTPTLLQDLLNLEVNFTNALSAGLVLGVMVVPTIASLSEDALTAVPLALRQGSFAMGANRMQTTLRVVLPAALSGVAASIVLGLSRAIGETMIVALAAGAQRNLSLDIREGMQTMTGFIAQTAGGENPVGSTSYNMLFAVGMLLFLITLVVNFISIAIVRRFRQEY
jgi:phosphate transport system permease protein